MRKSWVIALGALLLVSIIVPATLTYAKSLKADTVAELEQKYQAAGNGSGRVRILIVPGHEPGFGGAHYKGIYERDITVDIAGQLSEYLSQNPRLEVIVARSGEAWDEGLASYFHDERRSIESFVRKHKKEFTKLMKRGKVEERADVDQVDHAKAPSDVAFRLYGINKWANEQDMDLILHLHINDAPDHGPDEPGKNSGFAVYVPDAHYANAATSFPLGEAIAGRLAMMNATSTLPVENKGVVEDQDLIALGAYDTLPVPSVLIEYAYITEPRFMHPEMVPVITKDYAYATYLGVHDLLKDSPTAPYPTASLPFTFATSSLARTGSSTPGTYALQAALYTLDFYPAPTTASSTLTDCPIDGVMGICTVNGIEAFQKAQGFEATGALGPKTTAALNARFSSY